MPRVIKWAAVNNETLRCKKEIMPFVALSLYFSFLSSQKKIFICLFLFSSSFNEFIWFDKMVNSISDKQTSTFNWNWFQSHSSVWKRAQLWIVHYTHTAKNYEHSMYIIFSSSLIVVGKLLLTENKQPKSLCSRWMTQWYWLTVYYTFSIR